MIPELDEAAAACVAGDRERALRLLLRAYHIRPDPRIAPVVDQLCAVITATRTRPRGKTAAEKQAAWLALAANNDPADVGVLLQTLMDTKQIGALAERISALYRRDPDPRIADAMLAIVKEPPSFGGRLAREDVQHSARRVLASICDPRSKDALIEMGDPHAQRFGNPIRDTLDDAGLAALAKISASLPAGAPASPEVRDALFAAVYARPDDDTPRLVLADFLQERGDPRGEFIALQLGRGKGRATPRERELYENHVNEWLGPLAGQLRANPKFERGFLARCAVLRTTAPEILARLEMATVVDLDVSAWSFFPFRTAVMPSLRRLRGVDPRHPLPPALAALIDVDG